MFKRFEIVSFWTKISLVYTLCKACERSYKDQQYKLTEVPFQQDLKGHCENCGISVEDCETLRQEYEKNLTRQS